MKFREDWTETRGSTKGLYLGAMAVDSILIISFGGPEGPDDVVPFLRNVTKGRDIPAERMETVMEQYSIFGGKSPINDQNRDLITALEKALAERGLDLPVYWGNRNWTPTIQEAIEEMTLDGRRHGLAFITSAYSSYSGCKQYLEGIEEACRAIGDNAPKIEKIRQFFNHPGFIETFADNISKVLETSSGDAHLVFTAHSIPESMASKCRYESQLLNTASQIVATMGIDNNWTMAFQSRSGSPGTPWLEPDINDHLEFLNKNGVDSVVVVPIGFVSDHMEVVYDLDTRAAETAKTLGMDFKRVPTPGTDPKFVSMICELIEEQLDENSPRRFVGDMGCITCLPQQCCV